MITFPRTAVELHLLGRGTVIGSPNIAVFYNHGQEYFRQQLSPEGDFCEWFNFSPRLLREVVELYDPRAAEEWKRPFSHTHAPLSSRWHLLQRSLVDHILNAPFLDSFWVDEMATVLLKGIISDSYEARGQTAKRQKRNTQHTHRALTIEAQLFLQERFHQPLTLAQLAAALHSSPFHLARIFRQQTGYTIHQYLENLRLRTALERLPAFRNDLTTLALDVGYKSHSHFTHAFHRAFGLPPSQMSYQTALNTLAQ